jgi:hypothetical protein
MNLIILRFGLAYPTQAIFLGRFRQVFLIFSGRAATGWPGRLCGAARLAARNQIGSLVPQLAGAVKPATAVRAPKGWNCGLVHAFACGIGQAGR